MAAYNKFDQTIEDIFNGVHNFGTDVFKAYISNVLPVSANTVKANIAEITAGNGYAAGGQVVSITGNQVSGTYSAGTAAAVLTTTAAGGTVGPLRYVVIYNDTSASDSLLAWAVYPGGASITLQDGEAFSITLPTNLFTAS